MKSNLVSTASFFVVILIAVLGLGAFVAADWRPFERTTPGLRADIDSNRFVLPDAVLAMPFEDMRQFLIERTRWQIQNDWRLRQRFRASQRRTAAAVFEHLVASNYYEEGFRRMMRNNVLADFPKLGGYLHVRISYTGDEPIEDAVLRVPGVRYARVRVGPAGEIWDKRASRGPLRMAAQAEEHGPGNDVLAPAPGAAEQEAARDSQAETAADDGLRAVQPRDAPLVNEGTDVQSVHGLRIALGRLEKGGVRTVDVWVADLNRDPQWKWTDDVELTHRDGVGRVTFHQAVSPMLERFDRNPLVMIAMATVLLLMAFAIILLWFIGLFTRGRAAAVAS